MVTLQQSNLLPCPLILIILYLHNVVVCRQWFGTLTYLLDLKDGDPYNIFSLPFYDVRDSTRIDLSNFMLTTV